jgi:REP element-mobilizing transposase RayT
MSKTAMDCERRFMEGGPFFHLHTKPLENGLILQTLEELDIALSFLAIAILASDCRLLAFAIMNNHFHFILEGTEEACLAFYRDFQHRLAKYFSKEHRAGPVLAATPGLTSINNLKQLRDEIVYVCRNPFVDRQDVNPFSYKWCSGYLYYNDMLDMMSPGEAVSDWPVARRRAFNHERNADTDPRLRALNGVALPSCFTDFRRVMSFFENARQFTNWMLKSVESQLEIAKRIGDQLFLDDIELWQVVSGLCKKTYCVSHPRELSADNRVRLIKSLKYDYNASNAQIARCLGFPRATIDQMFPLSARGN